MATLLPVSKYTEARMAFSSFSTPVKVIAVIVGGIAALIITLSTLGGAAIGLALQHRSVQKKKESLGRSDSGNDRVIAHAQASGRAGFQVFQAEQARKAAATPATFNAYVLMPDNSEI